MKINLKNIKRINKDLLVFLTVAMIISCSKISYSSSTPAPIAEKVAFFRPVVDKLIARGVDSSFIYDLLGDSLTRFESKLVEINVTGYLKKPNYSRFYDDSSVDKSSKFIAEHFEQLSMAQDSFKIPKEVISSILWIETKHGSYLGNHPLSSVFFSIAMANQPKYLKMNIDNLEDDFEGSDEELVKLKEKIKLRAEKKAEWAINEIIALQKLNLSSPRKATRIKGSWAGAFGISQFLPSSYNSWAVDGNKDGRVDLFNVDDAIFSVANYLKQNGWQQTDTASWRKAVFHYNNSSAYVDAVLTLSKLSTTKSGN